MVDLLTGYIPIFSLFCEAVYPVGMTEVHNNFLRFTPNLYWYLPLDHQSYASYGDFYKL